MPVSILRVAFYVLCAPLVVCVGLLALVATCLPLFPTRIGLKNLKDRMGLTGAKARWILAGVFLNYLFYGLELLVMWPLGLMTFENQGDFNAFVGELKAKHNMTLGRDSFLVMGGHYGSFEVLGKAIADAIASQGFPHFYVLAKPSKNPIITWMMDFVRRTSGFHVLWTGRKELTQDMKNGAAKGHTLCLLADQKPSRGGFFAQLFGEACAWPDRGVEIGVSAQQVVFYVNCIRLSPGCFQLQFAEGTNTHRLGATADEKDSLLMAATTGTKGLKRLGNSQVNVNAWDPHTNPHTPADVALNIAGFAGWLEGLIRRHPSLWMWDYKKWSRSQQDPAARPAHTLEASE